MLLIPNLGAVDFGSDTKNLGPPCLEEVFSTIAEAGSHMRLPLLSLPPFSSSMGEMAHHPFPSKAFASQTKWAVKLDVSSPQSIIVFTSTQGCLWTALIQSCTTLTLTQFFSLSSHSALCYVSHGRCDVSHGTWTVWYSTAPNIGRLFLWTQFITDSKLSWRHSQKQNSHFCPLGKIFALTAYT